MPDRSKNRVFHDLSLCLFVAAAAGVGCSGTQREDASPRFLTVATDRYQAVFTAACEVARSEGMPPELVDRESGFIETMPRYAGSIVEPWAWKDQSAGDVVEGTLGFERRRAVFEFVPVGFDPAKPSSEAPIVGPVLPGSEREDHGSARRFAEAREFELRVSVAVERQFRPDLQAGAYTRVGGGYARDVTVRDDGTPRDRSTWTPVARDERLERMLLAKVAERIAVP